ncbi:hypothetical protein CHU98_g9410 [Xylaria longipes]|nr:hypothetical protein CHU98_g9410 [Xylaria longipes]
MYCFAELSNVCLVFDARTGARVSPRRARRDRGVHCLHEALCPLGRARARRVPAAGAGGWANELHGEVWVFDQGYWQKSAELFRSIMGASWDSVILDANMKRAIIEDHNSFFDSRDTYARLKVPWKRGVIYHGPPGNGKTISIKATMHMLYEREDPVPTLYVRTLASVYGPESALMAIFRKARQLAPCYLVFEDLDSIVSDQVRSYFLNEVDGLKNNDGIFMIGSTNHLDRLDPGISKRPSRFDRKYYFPDPDLEQRIAYCKFWQGKLADNKDVEFPDELCKAIAEITDKFSFAYMQEAFVAALLAMARRSKGGERRSEESLTRDVGGGWLDVCGGGDGHGDLDDLPLWVEIKKQIETLREGMESETQDKAVIAPPRPTLSPLDIVELRDKRYNCLDTPTPVYESTPASSPFETRERIPAMCYERYKGYTVCAHVDPQSTPTESKQCEELSATGRCAQGKTYVLVVGESTPTPCPGCWQLECRLMDAVGSLDDEHRGSATWRLWHRIGWLYKEVMLVLDVVYVRNTLYSEMHRWEGPRHNRQVLIAKWIAVFDEFKDWLCERLEKRDAQGRLYFPAGEEKDVRIEKKKVLQHLVRWMLVNMAQGQFDKLDIAIFREGLDMAFNNLIYQWDTHFPEEPGCDYAKEEFTKYWTNWFKKRDSVPTQGESPAS